MRYKPQSQDKLDKCQSSRRPRVNGATALRAETGCRRYDRIRQRALTGTRIHHDHIESRHVRDLNIWTGQTFRYITGSGSLLVHI